MRGHVKRRCPAPKPGQPQCPGKTCAHPYAFWIDQPRSEAGKRRQTTRSGFKTRKEAERALAKALTAVDDGDFRRPDSTTVDMYLRTWLAGLDRKPATLEAYRRVVDSHLVPALGRLRMQHLTPPHIKAAYRALQDDKGLSPTTVQLVHQVLSKALSDAASDGLLAANPAAHVKAPARNTPEMRTWSRQQASRFLRHVDGERLAAMWRLFLTAGMRRGEVAALRWQDVDFDRASLSVRQTGNMIGRVWTVGTPKGRKDASAKSRRLSLDAGTVEALRRHRTQQLQERMAWGDAWHDHGLVFVREDGRPLNPSTIGQQLTVRARQAELPHIRVHDLRHTYATLALEAGVHPKVVSERLGHANIGITLNLYSHVSEGMDRDAADRVAGLYT
jgi:integrase